MATTKMTKRDMFGILRDRVSDDADLVAFIDHELELLDKRATSERKPTKTQLENKVLQAEIIEFLTAADAPKTIKEMQAGIESLAEASNQKMTHLLSALVNGGIVTKTYEKKVPFYTIAQ